MAMHKFHTPALVARIERAAWRGIAEIEWWELNLWYDTQRITKRVWRDIKEKFDEEECGGDLYIHTTRYGVTLIVKSHKHDNLKTIELMCDSDTAEDDVDTAEDGVN